MNNYNNINMCSIFSLITSYNFLNNFDVSKDQHIKNLRISRENYEVEKIKYDLSFEKLLNYSNLKNNLISLTNPDLINANIISYQHIFLDESHCVIFLKNNNFFVVMYKKCNGKYYLRESHNNYQHDFNNRDELINYLNNIYSFNKHTIINDYVVEELSNIEYIVLKDSFKLFFLIKSENDIFNRICVNEGKDLSISFIKLKNIKYIPDNKNIEKKIIFHDLFKK